MHAEGRGRMRVWFLELLTNGPLGLHLISESFVTLYDKNVNIQYLLSIKNDFTGNKLKVIDYLFCIFIYFN